MVEKLDLILLDIMMPYIDGYHVAYEITAKLGNNAPRIVIITSRDTVREKGIALMSGAHEIIQKPFDLDELHVKLQEIFAKPA
jgi:DNA-binding response OmpR family regulator